MRLTVGDLRRKLCELPDDMEVYYQRIEDFYFREGGWPHLIVPWEYKDITKAISAFNGYVSELDGKDIFLIHAHY